MNIKQLQGSEENIEVYPSHFWQTDAWKNAKERSGCTSFWVEEGEAKTLVIERRAHWLKFWIPALWELPRGPIGSNKDIPALLEKILQMANEKKVGTVRVFPPFGNTKFWDDLPKNTLFSNYSTKAATEIFAEHTLMIDLSKTEEEILAQMKQKGRYNIKVARKKGVIISEEKDITNFWRLMKETSTRDGFRSCKKHVYTDTLKGFGDDAVLLTAKDETGEVLASMIFTYAQGMAIYYYGASSNRKRNLMAPYLLQWEGMMWAKNKGAMIYDFLGISPEDKPSHKLATVAGFKLKFGGERIVCDTGIDFVLR